MAIWWVHGRGDQEGGEYLAFTRIPPIPRTKLTGGQGVRWMGVGWGWIGGWIREVGVGDLVSRGGGGGGGGRRGLATDIGLGSDIIGCRKGGGGQGRTWWGIGLEPEAG